MRIAYLVNQYPSTSHSFIRREIQALERRGIEVVRFSVRDTKDALIEPTDVEEHSKTEVILCSGVLKLASAFMWLAIRRPISLLNALTITVRFGVKSRSVLRHFIYLMEAAWLSNRMDSLDVFRVHSHFGTNSTTVAMLCSALAPNVTFSFTVHGPEEFDRPESICLTEKIAHSAFVVAISSFGKSQLQRWCPQGDWKKIHIVRCGLENEFFDAGTPIRDCRQLTCLGRLCEQKGQLVLLHATNLLHQQGYDFSIVLVGDGPMRAEIEATIHDLGLGNSVTITGWQNREQVIQHLLESRAMVLPSFAEGLPVAIIEALALGRPVISTFVAGIPELVSPECGWLVPAGDVLSLSNAIADCLVKSTECQKKMAMIGMERTRDRHSIDREVELLEKLFRGGPL